jgi:UDP-GlcNAc:undecaprenyl-phosphate GlcNAc-1-phosphate transferase
LDLRLLSLWIASFGVSAAVTPIARRVGAGLGLLDHPDPRKLQRTAIPRTGGIGVLAGLAAGLGVLGALSGSLGVPIGREIFAICLGGLLVHGLGVLDDLWDIPAPAKLLAQSAAVGIVVWNGVTVEEISLGDARWSLGPFAAPLTAFFILGFVNALNLVDGLDGLAGGIASLAAFALAVTGALQGNLVLAALSLVLLGSTLGFLPYNFAKDRKAFLGDGGSMLLGYALAAAAVAGTRFAGGDPAPILVAMAAASVPILDTATTIVRRARNGQGLFRADSMHVHHRLVRFGLTPSRTVLTILAATLVIACQFLAGLVEGLQPLLAVSVLAAVLVTVGIRRAPRGVARQDNDAGFREILFYLLGAQDGGTPRLRGDVALSEVLAGSRARPVTAASGARPEARAVRSEGVESESVAATVPE